jgi:small subunit ribosomal protein S17
MKANKSSEKSNKKRLEGVVVSNKMTGAIVVKVNRQAAHPKYGKIIRSSKRFYAKTENKYEVGDSVVIEESRPLSKLIRWIVIEKK